METTAVGSALRWVHSSLWALLALLLTPVLSMVSGVGTMSGGSLVTPHPGETRVMCPLTEDVWQTKHNVIIRQFLDKRHTAKVFHCDWLNKDPDKPDCRSYHNFTLVSLEKNYVAASVPRTQLHKDAFYKCQLVPPDDDQPFTTCLVFHSDDAEDPPTTISDQPQPSDPTGANGDHTVVLAVFLTVVLILLVIVIVMAVVICRLRRARIRGTPENTAISTDEGYDVTPGGADTLSDTPCSSYSSSSTESEKHPGSPLLGGKNRTPVNETRYRITETPGVTIAGEGQCEALMMDYNNETR